MSERTIAVLCRLVDRFELFTPTLREHLADNFGEVLPHVLLGEMSRQLVHLAVERPDGRELEDVLRVLEEEFRAGEEEVRELLAVSFLENLPTPLESGHEIRDRLGAGLAAELGGGITHVWIVE
jgi:hypothetical protein